jgi:exodeoxyribonuclease-5
VGIEYSPALNIEFLKTSFNLSINQFELTDVVRQLEDSAILENATYLRQKIHINNSEPPFFIKIIMLI